jgi:hypothetical protein
VAKPLANAPFPNPNLPPHRIIRNFSRNQPTFTPHYKALNLWT